MIPRIELDEMTDEQLEQIANATEADYKVTAIRAGGFGDQLLTLEFASWYDLRAFVMSPAVAGIIAQL